MEFAWGDRFRAFVSKPAMQISGIVLEHPSFVFRLSTEHSTLDVRPGQTRVTELPSDCNPSQYFSPIPTVLTPQASGEKKGRVIAVTGARAVWQCAAGAGLVLWIEVPKENWAQIFSCLTPSKPDRSPSKWQVLGSMRIQTSDGREVQIWLYDTFKGQGAFSVGPSLERRSYYRGGDSACLQNALRTAYTSWERGNGTSTKVK